MKTRFSGLGFAVFLSLIWLTPNHSCAATDKPKVAVLDFKTVGDTADLGRGAAEILRTTLLEAGTYTVVERSMLRQVLKEQKLGLTGVVNQNTAVGIGKLLGAKLVAVGSVVKMGESYTLSVRFVDVETGEVVAGKKLTAQSREDIPRLCSQIVKLLAENKPTEEQGKELPHQHPSVIKPATTQSTKATHPPTAGNWALGGFYPGASLKYVTSGKSAWELRGQSGSGVLALGTRYYRYFTRASNPRLFFGIEADYLTFKGSVSKGTGFAGGAFVGGEIFLTRHIGLLMDFGPMYLSLSDTNFSQSASNLEYVMNMGIYWHFK